MTVATIAIMGMGGMGHAVAATLREGGHRVMTALAGRSARSRDFAHAAGVEDAGTLDALIEQAEIVLSIMPPAAAEAFAAEVAQSMARCGNRPVFADCNAVSPATTARIGKRIAAAGAPYIDGGIIGAPPGEGAPTRLYLSGLEAGRLQEIRRPDLLIHLLEGGIGAASGLKMCYAALTKATMALDAAVLIAARRLDLHRPLHAELAQSQEAALRRMERRVPWLATDAERWIAEMEEIAATFEGVGLPGDIHAGAAALYRLLAATPLAGETRETADRSRSLADAVAVFAAALDDERDERDDAAE